MPQMFSASNERIHVTNSEGHTVFDTDEAMMTLFSVLEGTVSLPPRGPNTFISPFAGYLLSSDQLYPSGETPVILATGVISGGSDYPWQATTFNTCGCFITNLAWRQVPGRGWSLSAIRVVEFVFMKESGRERLFLREQAANGNPTLSMSAVTIRYKLYIGAIRP